MRQNIVDSITVITGLVTILGWGYVGYRKWRSNKRITIRLMDKNNPGSLIYQIAHEPRRANLSRSEILGIIGLASAGEKFTFQHLKDPAFLMDIDNIIKGKSSRLDIPVTQKEMKPFLHPETTI